MLDWNHYLKLVPVFEEAMHLCDVGNGRRARSMIDAIRDALPVINRTAWNVSYSYEWSPLMSILDEATASDSFQVWDREEGRTHEQRIAAFKRCVRIAKSKYLRTR